MQSTKEKRLEYKRRCRYRQLLGLTSLISVLSVLCNIISCKVSPLYNTNYTLSLSAVIYVGVFFVINFISEFHGKSQSYYTVYVSFLCQVAAAAVMLICNKLPATDADISNALRVVTSHNFAFLLGSLAAYAAAIIIDLMVYDCFRITNVSSGIASALALIVSQAVNTMIFTIIGYGVAFNWIFDDGDFWGRCGQLFLGQYIVKLILIAVLSPVFSAICGWYKEYSNN